MPVNLTIPKQIPHKAAGNLFVLRLSGVAALGGLLFGFDTAVISGTIPYIRAFFKLDDAALGWAVSSLLIGCAIGALFAGKLADKMGRKKVLITSAMIFGISGILAGLAPVLSCFIVVRIGGGLAVGSVAMVSPLYIAECVPAGQRGRLVALYQLAILSGIMLAYFSNYLLDPVGPDNWRWMFGVQAIPAIIFGLLLFSVPETPRWLVMQKRYAAALEVLGRIMPVEEAEPELQRIQQFSKVKSAGLAVLLSRAYRRVLWTGILLAVFQQVTGINAILYYAPAIFRETGLDHASALWQTVLIGLVNMLSTFAAILLVDKVGRRKLLLFGSLLMGGALVGTALCFHWHYFEHYLFLAFVLLYIAAFGGTLGAVTWVYLSEIFPNAIRGMALSAATLALWLADFFVSWSFPVITGRLGTPVTLMVYALMCLLALLFIWRRLPETKGLPLEAMETLFTASKNTD